MKFSKFNVYSKYDDNSYWVYNTLTTSTIILDSISFNDILVRKNLNSTKVDMNELYEMGFIIDDNFDELLYLKNLRDIVVNSNKKITDIMIAPTMDCNARCYYCFEHGSHREKMNTETADAIAEYIETHWNHELFNVSWFGGEPLMAIDVIDYLSNQLRNRDVKFTSKILTNGYALTHSVINKALHDWNTTKIQISIDDLFNDYNQIKNFKNVLNNISPFEKVIENTGNALSSGIDVRVRINFNPLKKEHATSVMDFLQNKFEKFANFSSYFAPIDSFSHIVPPVADEFPEFSEHPFLSLIKHSQKYGYYSGNKRGISKNFIFDEKGLLASLKLYPSPTNCYASCPSVFAIDSKGDLYKCHRVLGKGNKYCSGNIICQGGCKINTYIYGDNHACSPIKSIFKDLIDYYIRCLINNDNL